MLGPTHRSSSHCDVGANSLPRHLSLEGHLDNNGFNKVITEPEQCHFVKFHAYAKSTHQTLKVPIHAFIYHNMNKEI